MFFRLFLTFLASTSASELSGCRKKEGLISLHQSDSPVNGSCEETGLGWKGRPMDFIEDKDQFFTKWTDFFSHPECVDKIFVHISDKDGTNEQQIRIKENFTLVNVTGQNPSNTILITNRPESEICKLRSFTSRLVFVPKFFDNRNLLCYETKQTIAPNAEHPLHAHFLNNIGPIKERANDRVGVNIFWRRGMVDTCVKAVNWTLNENTTRVEKNLNKSKDEDSIFIPGKCETQEVTLTYIFSEESNFQIDDATLELRVQAFTEKCLQVDGEGPEGSEVLLLKTGSAIGGFVAALIIAFIIVVIVMMKRKCRKKEDQKEMKDENPIYGLYARNSLESLPTESEVKDENDYYGI